MNNQTEQEQIMFSVLVPVYNVERYLEECVRSVLNQTYRNFELILVDDGSSDGSGVICDRYAAEYENVKSIRKKNEGQLLTRLCAMEKAVGEYYVFLDSDDTLKPHALQTIYQTIQACSCDCVVYGLDRVADGRVIASITVSEPIHITDKRELYRRFFTSDEYNPMCRKAIKSSLMKRKDYTGYDHIRHAEDLLQSLDVLKNSQSVMLIPDTLYNYRMNPSSVSHGVRYENFKIDFTVREEVSAFLRQEGVFSEEDYQAYRGYMVYILTETVKMIARFDTEVQNKITLLRQVKETSFYDWICASGTYNRDFLKKNAVIYKLFRCNLYRMIILVVRMYSFFTKSK